MEFQMPLGFDVHVIAQLHVYVLTVKFLKLPDLIFCLSHTFIVISNY